MIKKSKEMNRAVVIGASVAGLLAARVLSDCFEEVVIIERDVLPKDGPSHRKGLPQAHHQHILLTRGREVFEQLFPGFDAALAATGAELADHTLDMELFSAAGKLPRFASGIELRLASRLQIDWILLGFVRQLKNIRFIEKASVAGLDYDGQKVRAVEFANRKPLLASLVVDASGRGSMTPKWLDAMGLARPAEQVIDAKLGYASRFYERSKKKPTPFKAVTMTPVPLSNPRGVGLWQVEGNRWLLSLIGTAGHYPTTDESEFLKFASQLADPIVLNTIRNAKPCSDIVAFRGTTNRWRHYEKLKQWPAQFLVIGDAYCAFSPFYGQGMTMAALSALALQEALQNHSHDGAPDFEAVQHQYFRKTGKLFKAPWILATGEDLRWPTTTGGTRDLISAVSHRVIDQLIPLSTHSKVLVRNFLRISNMSASPAILLDPRILAQWAQHWLRRPSKASAPQSH